MWYQSVFTCGYFAAIAFSRSSQYGIEIEMPLDLVAEVRCFFGRERASFAFQQARAGYAAGAARGIATWLALAALLAVIALCTLAIGLVISLAPLLGPWGATAVVVGALLALAAISALLGMRAIRRVKRNAFPAEAA